MKKMNLGIAASLIGLLGVTSAFAGDHDPKHIIPLLGEAKMSLLEGIEFAEKVSGVATSAKFEIADDGKLVLSVYTVPEGLDGEPEKATLSELSGVVTDSPFKYQVEVFADKAHIARAAVHMTLFQLSCLNLKDVIHRALSVKKGTVIDVRNPKVDAGRPVASVIIVDAAKTVYTVTVDLDGGRTQISRH
jgi:hypothetical protein